MIDNYDENTAYNNQDEFVIKQLVNDKSMTICDATESWFKSKTRKLIHKERLIHYAPPRCYFEFEKEMCGNPYWMKVTEV